MIYELALKDMEHWKSGGDVGFRQKAVCGLSRSICVGHSVALEYRSEGVGGLEGR